MFFESFLHIYIVHCLLSSLHFLILLKLIRFSIHLTSPSSSFILLVSFHDPPALTRTICVTTGLELSLVACCSCCLSPRCPFTAVLVQVIIEPAISMFAPTVARSHRELRGISAKEYAPKGIQRKPWQAGWKYRASDCVKPTSVVPSATSHRVFN